MKKRTFLSAVCICLTAAMLLCALPSCKDEPSTDVQEPTQEDTPMEFISLNGQWNFYRDDAAVAGTTEHGAAGTLFSQGNQHAADAASGN